MLAIVLRRKDFREYDQIISLFTRSEGKVELLARGIKKITSKLSGHLLPGSLVDMELAKGKEINHLTKAININIFRGIRADWTKSVVAKQLLELTDRATKTQAVDPGIFDLLLKFLFLIDRVDALGQSIVYGFILQLYSQLGFRPGINECIFCGEPPTVQTVFSITQGGIVCANCRVQINPTERIYNLHADNIFYLRQLLAQEAAVINEMETDEKIFELIKEFVTFHGEHELTILN